jgi:DNA polymerase-3 subunit gamma/tau
MALDLKYRPKKFADILGNKAVVQLLHQLSRGGKLGERSLMFGGPKGCGKTSLARIVACAVVCNDLQDGEPCGVCNACLGVRQESAESFEEFDAATQGSVEHMRTIVSELDYGNLNGKPSVFILDEAQRLTKQAQDALLKSIEDRRMLVILCTTEPHKIQGPLRDRMTEFPVSAPPVDVLLGHLHRVCEAESIQAPDDALQLIMQAQSNCPRTCLTALEMLSSAGPITVDDVRTYFRLGATEKLVAALEGLSSDPKVALSAISELLDTEGPSWVRDTTIQVVTSAVRASVGAKPTLMVPASLYATRGPAWLAVAKALGQLDKPGAADVEAILFEAIPNLPAATTPLPADWEKRLSTPPTPPTPAPQAAPPQAAPVQQAPPQPAPAPKAPEPKPEVKAEPPRRIVKPKALEIDGVSFTPAEKLTSVDDKLEKGSRGAPIATGPTSAPDVRLDKDLHPMAPKEFARGFLQRIKGQE